MALSANADKALQQVKNGLLMLYGAEYFTEDEWIKINGLIHKDKYAFTQGPPPNVLEEELISFDDPKDNLNVKTEALNAYELIIKETGNVSANELSSPSSDLADKSELETPNTTSAEVSTDDESAPSRESTKDNTAMDDMVEMMTPEVAVETVKSASTKEGSNGGLPAGCTQAQLDEVRAFNAGLTKAGAKKSRPKYTKEEEAYPSPDWSENGTSKSERMVEVATFEDAAPTDQDIQTWADEVNAPEPLTLEVPAVSKDTPVSGWAVSPPLRSPVVSKKEVLPVKKALVEQFVKAHGKLPRNINDIYQPNNPEFDPLKRPYSRASARTTRTTVARSVAPAPTPKPKLIGPQLQVVSGTVLVAQSSAPKTHQMAIEVVAGDQIQVLKHVSGVHHIGINLRTNQRGQFTESIFKMDPTLLIERQQQIAQKESAKHRPTGSVSTTVSKKMDRFENTNAAEWDEVPVTRSKTVAPTPVRPSGGLSTSRFAVLGDLDSKSESSDVVQGITRKEMQQMIDDTFAQRLDARNTSSPKPPTAPRSRSFGNEPLQKVAPKTAVCWFWATPGKECRFTDDQCRDAHEFLPVAPGEPANLRMGKPTWGALADYLPPSPLKPGKTCYFWATTGQCTGGASCRYLHELGAEGGIATQPNHWKKDWSLLRKKKDDWSWGEEKEDVAGELVLEEVKSGWGEESSDKYKPPHIKALEETAKIEAVGW